MILISTMRGNAVNISGKVTGQIIYCKINNYLLCIYAYISRVLATYSKCLSNIYSYLLFKKKSKHKKTKKTKMFHNLLFSFLI